MYQEPEPLTRRQRFQYAVASFETILGGRDWESKGVLAKEGEDGVGLLLQLKVQWSGI